MCTLAPGKWAIVDAEGHAHRGLLDGDRRQCLGLLDVGDRIADPGLADPGDRDDVAGPSLIHLDPIQPLEGEQLADLGWLDRPVSIDMRYLLAALNRTAQEPPDQDFAFVGVVNGVSHQELHWLNRLDLGGWQFVEDGLEEWL